MWVGGVFLRPRSLALLVRNTMIIIVIIIIIVNVVLVVDQLECGRRGRANGPGRPTQPFI